MQKRVLFLMVCSVVGSSFAMDKPLRAGQKRANPIGHIKNNSSFDIENLTIKVKLGGKRGRVTIPQLQRGGVATFNILEATDKSGKPILDRGELVESMHIFKVQPKVCVNRLTNTRAKCRGRFKPSEDKRVFTIFNERPGVVKVQRGEHGLKKGKKPFTEPQPRYVYVK